MNDQPDKFEWPKVGEIFTDKTKKRWLEVTEIRVKDPQWRHIIGVVWGEYAGHTLDIKVPYSCSADVFQRIWKWPALEKQVVS